MNFALRGIFGKLSCNSPLLYISVLKNHKTARINQIIEGYSYEEYIFDNYPVVERIGPLICTVQGEFRCMGEKVIKRINILNNIA